MNVCGRKRSSYFLFGVRVTLVMVALLVTKGGLVLGLGDVHTSAVTVAQLVETEHLVIDVLQDYISKEEIRLQAIKR